MSASVFCVLRRSYTTNKPWGGVDRGDQIRAHFGGFASQSHFKKWYKKTLMAVLDCMLLNSLRLWNMSAEKLTTRKLLTRYEFMQAVCHELLHYQTKSLVSPLKTGRCINLRDNYRVDDVNGRHQIVESSAGKRCLVCAMENNQYIVQAKALGIFNQTRAQQIIKLSFLGVKKQVCYCKECNIDAHNYVVSKHTKFVHALFPSMTCMQIFHSRLGSEIWKTKGKGRKKVVTHYKHPIVEEVKRAVQQHLTEY